MSQSESSQARNRVMPESELIARQLMSAVFFNKTDQVEALLLSSAHLNIVLGKEDQKSFLVFCADMWYWFSLPLQNFIIASNIIDNNKLFEAMWGAFKINSLQSLREYENLFLPNLEDITEFVVMAAMEREAKMLFNRVKRITDALDFIRPNPLNDILNCFRQLHETFPKVVGIENIQAIETGVVL